VVTEPPPAEQNIPSGQRPNMYDHSIRVPTLVRWPGRVQPGSVVERTVANLDWYPTILSAAGAPLPEGETIRGRSIVPLLEGKEIEWDDDFYAEYSTHHQSHTHMRMIRSGGWKLIRDFLNPARDELYDLTDDPAEGKNLIHSDTPEVQRMIAELHEKLVARMRESGDPVLADAKAKLAPR
jgi:uncharacterized sulfatase